MQPPVTHQSNREDLRYNLRAKISKQDYVDRELKPYYYKNNTAPVVTLEQAQTLMS